MFFAIIVVFAIFAIGRGPDLTNITSFAQPGYSLQLALTRPLAAQRVAAK